MNAIEQSRSVCSGFVLDLYETFAQRENELVGHFHAAVESDLDLGLVLVHSILSSKSVRHTITQLSDLHCEWEPFNISSLLD